MKRWQKIAVGALAALAVGYIFCLPRDLFRGVPCSTVVTDRGGELLGARTASDGQWRFPPCDTVPKRYKTALIQFEDRYFRYHPGVNPIAIVRALAGNLKAGEVTSGGSTITMQVIRMSRGRERTLWQKMVEAVLALRLEESRSKDEILALYASYAPFGGNVVGLEAASWRYFSRPADELSWAEAATLAVLPNSPSSMHPGKNRDALMDKRNKLLGRLMDHGDIDMETYQLAIAEPLPEAPQPLPSLAPQLVDHYCKAFPGKRVVTGIDIDLQRNVLEAVSRASDGLAREGIADMAAVVIDIRSGEVVAYVGNSSPDRDRPGKAVDIARSPRSTGSILKPFLYAGALQEGVILPRTLLKDTPVNINGFSPQNFDLRFYGAVPADEALARSLNVPAVHLLRAYGVPRFHRLLQDAGLTTLTRSSSNYGLSLILGGGEGTLLEITRAYASMVRSYDGLAPDFPLRDPYALWYTFKALRDVRRPDEVDYRLIQSVRTAAWKTGTSYGFRDAWAVGVTPDYAVGVWAGNAAGQGAPGLIGARAAAPTLFDILNLLPPGKAWFDEPAATEGGEAAEVCTLSGHLAGMHCPEREAVMLPSKAAASEPCPYHREVDGSDVFILPPAMEWYYRPHHPEYEVPKVSDTPPMEFIYPESGAIIYLPRQLDGSVEGAVFQLAHRSSSATVWWHMDGNYLGETRYLHQMRLVPSVGRHTLVAVDEEGNTVSVGFSVRE